MAECIRDPNDCPVNSRVESLEKQFDEYRAHSRVEHKEFYSRLEASERAQAVTQNMLAQIADNTEEIKRGQRNQSEAIAELQARPGKRWDGIVDKVIWAVVAAVIAFLLGKFGL